jgi:hypothetical protein
MLSNDKLINQSINHSTTSIKKKQDIFLLKEYTSLIIIGTESAGDKLFGEPLVVQI